MKPHPFKPFVSYLVIAPDKPIYSDWCTHFDKPLAVLATLTEEEMDAAHCGRNKTDPIHEEPST